MLSSSFDFMAGQVDSVLPNGGNVYIDTSNSGSGVCSVVSSIVFIANSIAKSQTKGLCGIIWAHETRLVIG